MELNERNEKVLDFVVRDYIKSAIPVSSGRIAERKTILGSSATIRNAMLELDDAGYLYQPHTSAGRAPTDKGYRYFIKNLLELKKPESSVQLRVDEILLDMEKYMDNVFSDLSSELASELRLFAGVGFLEGNEFFGKGLSSVLLEPEFEERNMAAKFADYTENLSVELNTAIMTYKTPVYDVEDFGSVRIFINSKNCGRAVLFSVGPRRMDYEKATSLLKYAADKFI